MLRRVLLLAALGVAGALVAGAALMLRAPAPEALCDHILAVTLAEAEKTDLEPETRAQLERSLRDACIRHKRDKQRLRGRIVYARYARCVLEATTLAQIERC